MKLWRLSIGALLALVGCSQKPSLSVIVKEVRYHRAPDFRGDTVDLYATIEIPADTNQKRPLLILVHGGGFEAGSRNQNFLRRMARDFAELGYVTARISYRLGLPRNWSAWDWLAANIRAVQDLRTFIRYMKYQAAHGNPYGIDTTRIIALGWSAGGFTVLQAAFLTTPEEFVLLPQADTVRLRLMGGLYGTAYPEHTSDFWAVVSLSGAVYRTEWIAPEKITHVITFHPIHDRVVYYGQQITRRGIRWYGGGTIHKVAKQKGMSTIHLTVRHKLKTIDPHCLIGEELFTSFAYPEFTQNLQQVLEKLLKGQKVPENYLELEFPLPEVILSAIKEAICRTVRKDKYECTLGYIRYLLEYIKGNISVEPLPAEILNSAQLTDDSDS